MQPGAGKGTVVNYWASTVAKDLNFQPLRAGSQIWVQATHQYDGWKGKASSRTFNHRKCSRTSCHTKSRLGHCTEYSVVVIVTHFSRQWTQWANGIPPYCNRADFAANRKDNHGPFVFHYRPSFGYLEHLHSLGPSTDLCVIRTLVPHACCPHTHTPSGLVTTHNGCRKTTRSAVMFENGFLHKP